MPTELLWRHITFCDVRITFLCFIESGGAHIAEGCSEVAGIVAKSFVWVTREWKNGSSLIGFQNRWLS